MATLQVTETCPPADQPGGRQDSGMGQSRKSVGGVSHRARVYGWDLEGTERRKTGSLEGAGLGHESRGASNQNEEAGEES